MTAHRRVQLVCGACHLQSRSSVEAQSWTRIVSAWSRIASRWTCHLGDDVVVVVSAMGKTTDQLLRLADDVSSVQPGAKIDMLLTAGERISMALVCMALAELGIEAVSYTGSQAGIITDTTHTKAKILEVRGRPPAGVARQRRRSRRRRLPGRLGRERRDDARPRWLGHDGSCARSRAWRRPLRDLHRCLGGVLARTRGSCPPHGDCTQFRSRR